MPFRTTATQLKLVLLAILLCSCLAAAVPAPFASAAAVELTAPIKAAFDATVKAADAGNAAKLTRLYADLAALLAQDVALEARIKTAHFANEEAIGAARKRIRDIDADKLAKLDAQVKQAKERYRPLFDAYAGLNKQITAARLLKNKTLNSLLRTQADAMKLPVQLAREDIRAKTEAHQDAKATAARKIKSARDWLSAVEPLQTQIKAHRSAAGLPRSSRSPAWTNFKHASKKSEVRGTLDSLGMLTTLSRQIVERQQKILALEGKIAEIVAETKARYA
ncbi:hypothetical protein ACFPPD_11350 [Cohnella suwonensis]|uniref:Uncharacterized protein n=1 Tax=Cohnella suwonensis TaxID=696072 RepID=A0ABW0LTY6_9BACL